MMWITLINTYIKTIKTIFIQHTKIVRTSMHIESNLPVIESNRVIEYNFPCIKPRSLQDKRAISTCVIAHSYYPDIIKPFIIKPFT